MKGKRVLSEGLWLLKLIAATAILALGFDVFLEPSNISFGGVSGVAMVIRSLLGRDTILGIGTVPLFVLLLNIPLFFVGYKAIGKRFFFGSLLGALLTSVFMQLFLPLKSLLANQTDKLIMAIFGGLLCGFSVGLTMVSGASTGGTDIVARLLKTKFRNLPIGTLTLVVDILIITANGLVNRDLVSILYSAVAIYVSATMMDVVVYRFDYSKVALIITDHYEEVAEAIGSKLQRGVTLLQAKGFYHRTDKYVLLSAVKRSQLADLQELVIEIDENAFIIIQEAHQVLGDGFKRYSDKAL